MDEQSKQPVDRSRGRTLTDARQLPPIPAPAESRMKKGESPGNTPGKVSDSWADDLDLAELQADIPRRAPVKQKVNVPPPLPRATKAPTVPKKSKSLVASWQAQPVAIRWSTAAALPLTCITIALLFVFLPRSRPAENAADHPEQAVVTIEPTAQSAGMNSAEEARELPEDLPDTELLTHFSSLAAHLPVPQAGPAAATISDPETAAESATDMTPEPQLEPEPAVLPVEKVAVNDGNQTPSTSDDLAGHIEAAAALISSGKGKEAITRLRRASNLYPKDIRPDFYLGLLHSGVGINDLKIAEGHFKRVLDRSPGNIPALNNLALVEIKLHRFEAARNHLALAADNANRPGEVNQNLIRLVNQAKKLDVPNGVLKRIGTLKANPADFRPRTGWMYMSVAAPETSQDEYKSFCRGGTLEDPSCSICNGRASLPCKGCGGRGNVLLAGSVSETRNLGVNSSTMTSPTTTKVACNNCSGTGRVDCHDCEDGRDLELGR